MSNTTTISAGDNYQLYEEHTPERPEEPKTAVRLSLSLREAKVELSAAEGNVTVTLPEELVDALDLRSEERRQKLWEHQFIEGAILEARRLREAGKDKEAARAFEGIIGTLLLKKQEDARSSSERCFSAPLSYVDSRGCVRVPPDVVERLGLRNGGGVYFVMHDEGHAELYTDDQFVEKFLGGNKEEEETDITDS